MPDWIVSVLLPFAVSLIEKYGIPALEQRFPSLIPLINAVLALIGGGDPHPALQGTADHFNSLVAMAPSVKKT